MIIGFSGSSGSGKSTTVRDVAFLLQEKGERVKVLEEVTQRLFKMYSLVFKVKSLQDLREKEDLYLLFEQDWLNVHLQEIRRNQEKDCILLCDRTAFDVLPYLLLHCRRSADPLVFDNLVEKLRRISENPPYSAVFFFPPLKTITENRHSIRAPEDLLTRAAQGYLLRGFLPQELTVPVETQD
ncbi:MAG: AAA family ATPase, partial [Candidatus Atribacteria bacterium]|nr:AAA family ATPase [Candidatus Atribacteria bacterium]MCD6349248.1 AAA family ATPase [Candidatus Atribacteria bacterium]